MNTQHFMGEVSRPKPADPKNWEPTTNTSCYVCASQRNGSETPMTHKRNIDTELGDQTKMQNARIDAANGDRNITTPLTQCDMLCNALLHWKIFEIHETEAVVPELQHVFFAWGAPACNWHVMRLSTNLDLAFCASCARQITTRSCIDRMCAPNCKLFIGGRAMETWPKKQTVLLKQHCAIHKTQTRTPKRKVHHTTCRNIHLEATTSDLNISRFSSTLACPTPKFCATSKPKLTVQLKQHESTAWILLLMRIPKSNIFLRSEQNIRTWANC